MTFVTNNLELLTQRAVHVETLKQHILSLAVRGLLVPQDPEDEPAGAGLKQIKQGRVPYEAPKQWVWVRLEEISNKVHYGYTASADESIKTVRLLRITDIQNNYVHWEQVPGCKISEKEIKKYQLQENDILIARTGGTIGKSYLVKNISVNAVFASYLIRIIPKRNVDSEYLKLFIESPIYWGQLFDAASGTGQPNVNATSLKSLQVPLPPLPEQHRIVEKVTSLFALIDRLSGMTREGEETRRRWRRALLHELGEAGSVAVVRQRWSQLSAHFDTLIDSKEAVQDLRQVILQLAVRGVLVVQDPADEPAGELLRRIRAEKAKLGKKEKGVEPVKAEEVPYEVPRGWEWCRLLHLGYMTGGGTPSKNNPEFWDGDILWVTPKDMKFDVIADSQDKITAKGVENSSASLIPPQSVLIVGRSGILQRTLPVGINSVSCTVNQDIKVLVPYLPEMARYIQLLLKGHETLILKELVKGGTTVQSLKYDQFQSHPFPLPPLSEQRRIVERVERLMGWCDALEAGMEEREGVMDKLVSAVNGLIK